MLECPPQLQAHHPLHSRVETNICVHQKEACSAADWQGLTEVLVFQLSGCNSVGEKNKQTNIVIFSCVSSSDDRSLRT